MGSIGISSHLTREIEPVGETVIDMQWMAECLRLAGKGEGAVSPNPMVGAVLVRKNRLLSSGFHHRFGGDHAEVECLRRARGTAKGATLYVNLEPCAHHGKTPPCTDRIIESGVRRIVIGMKDPNPLVSGKGIRILRRAGIQVDVGILEQECRQLNRAFIHHITSGLPFVHLKVAQTLDGRIAGVAGQTVLISSRESRRLVHSWRSKHDAVLVGAATVRNDDPQLSVRLTRGRNPSVIIIDGNLTVPLSAKVLRGRLRHRVLVCAGASAVRKKSAKVRSLQRRGIEVLSFTDRKGRIPFRPMLRGLYRLGIGSILVEGGSEIFGRFLYGGLANQVSLFIAPKVMGSGLEAFASGRRFTKTLTGEFQRTTITEVGGDILIQYFLT